jgi:hypothetical protein
VFRIPVPRVLAWSCDGAKNAVQDEYILEEKASGVRLGAVWRDLPWKAKLDIVVQVAEFDRALCGVRFKMHGCIYFKEDLERLTGKADAMQLKLGQEDSTLEQYAMGPLTKAQLWVNGREDMDIDRGPCTSKAPY